VLAGNRSCKNRHQHLDRCPAQCAWIVRISGGANDRPGAVFGRGDQPGHLGPFRYLLLVAQILVEVGNADSGADPFDGDVVESLQEVVEEIKLPFVGWREVGVTALGAVRLVTGTIPGEKGFAQPRPRRNDRDRSRRDPLAFVEDEEVGRLQDGHGSRNRHQIVHQVGSLQVQVGRERGLIHDPRQIGGLHVARDDRAGDRKRSHVNCHVGVREKLSHHGLQTGIVGAMYFGLNQRFARPRLTRVDRQVGLRAANITCNQHGQVLTSCRKRW
jgi:hypothetical protein